MPVFEPLIGRWHVQGANRRAIVVLISAVLLWGGGSAAARSASTEVPGTTADTPTWQRVPTDAAIAGGGSRGLKLRSLATVPGGFLAAGGDSRGAVILSS